mgnify:CR=1 FL=1
MTGEVDRKSSSRPTLIQRIDFYEPTGTYGAFSNFFETPITIDGLIYPTFRRRSFTGRLRLPEVRSTPSWSLLSRLRTRRRSWRTSRSREATSGFRISMQPSNIKTIRPGDQMTGSFHKEVINDKTAASTPSKKAFQSTWTEMNRLLRRWCRCRYDRPSRVLLNIEDVSKESHLEFRSDLLTFFRSLSGDAAHEL